MISTTNPGNHHTKYLGLSSDQKPKAKNGSFFYEMDTGILFAFDEENDDWLPSPGGGGGGGGTTVIANPELVGDEDNLTGIQIGNVKYAVPAGGSGEEVILFENLPRFYTDVNNQTGEVTLEFEGPVSDFKNFLEQAALHNNSFDCLLAIDTICLASVQITPSSVENDPNHGYIHIYSYGYYEYDISADYTLGQDDDNVIFTLSSYNKYSEKDEPISFNLDKENQSLSLIADWWLLLNRIGATGQTMVLLVAQDGSVQEASLEMMFSASEPDNHFEIRSIGLPVIYIDGTVEADKDEVDHIIGLNFIIENYEEQPISGGEKPLTDFIAETYLQKGERLYSIDKIIINDEDSKTWDEYLEWLYPNRVLDPFLSDSRFTSISLPTSSPDAEIEISTVDGDAVNSVILYPTNLLARVCIISYTGTAPALEPQPLVIHLTYHEPL